MTEPDQPEDAKPEDAKPEDAKPEDAKPEDAKPEDAKPEDAKPEDAKPEDAKPEDAKPEDAKPEDAKPEDAKPPGEDDVPVARRKASKKGLLLGLGSGAGVVVLLVLAAFVWPGFLAGPGKPDDKAAAAVAALNSKNSAALDEVSCHDPHGRTVPQIAPQVLQMIQQVNLAGPVELMLDTQAQAPVDLTVNVQGTTRRLPAFMVLSVTDGQWCLFGISPPAE